MPLYDAVKDLKLVVEDVGHEPLALPLGFMTRRTTVFHLRGAGEEGIGEDVTYEEEHHGDVRLPELVGEHTLDSFSALVEDAPGYRRWGLEAAALDLALRQAGRSLADVLGREPQPITFVVSLRLGEPPSADPVTRRVAAYPGLQFKLDYQASWDEELLATLAATGAVESIDFKGAYKGTPVDVDTVPELYRRCAEVFPDAWLEDPDLTDPAADEALRPHRDRITWDAPIHGVADIEALPFQPKTINVKPSRIGTWKKLLHTYEWCAERGITNYGGGQSELGVGRGQIQYLASIFHGGEANDIAPSGYDWNDFPVTGLPANPLPPDLEPAGFRRRS